jgi:hypothetical protein
VAIHHIQMQGFDTGLLEPLDFSLQIGKVAQQQRGENRWANPPK